MNCNKHQQQHEHTHGPGCGHTGIRTENQTAYLHDGQLHVRHGEHLDDTAVRVSEQNPDRCTPEHACVGHAAQHIHGPDCGHQQVPHGDHSDYLVGDHLHHAHGDHCDNHGAIEIDHSIKAA